MITNADIRTHFYIYIGYKVPETYIAPPPIEGVTDIYYNQEKTAEPD